ncbi:MAG: flagellar hook-length control protein FliK [Alphaproteobacteria bacterium]|nr:flagellar hook-length control protein FliK [Alphaproteobacteria bacterium]
MADIAALTAMTKATALKVPATTAADGKSPDGLGAPFGALLQQLAQTPSNDAGPPDAGGDSSAPSLGAIAPVASATPPQPSPQMPPAVAVTGAAPAKPAATQNDPAAESLALAAQAQSGVEATNVAVPADPQTRNASDKRPAPEAKSDQEKAASPDPKTAPADIGLAVVLVQVQAGTTPAAGNAASAIDIASGRAATPTANAKPPGQTQPGDKAVADAAGAAAGDGNQPAVNANNPGGSAQDAVFGTPEAGVNNGKVNDKPAQSAAASPHNTAPSAPQPPPSSASGQSAGVGLTAASVQPPGGSPANPSVNVNFGVAPQYHDSHAISTLDTFGATIAAKSIDGIKHFDIRMDPPELGRVEVYLSVDASGKAQANLVVDKPQTLALLQHDASNLTRSLNDAGVNLSNNGLNFSLRGQDRQNDGGGVVKGRSRALSVKALMGMDAISNLNFLSSQAPYSARLDIRV